MSTTETTTEQATDEQEPTMTAPTDAAPETEPTEPGETETPEEEQQEPAEQPEDGRAGREAAKYRRQAREAEAERDTIRDQLTAARDEIIRQHLAQPVQVEALNPDGTRKTNFGPEGHQRNVTLNHPDDLFRFTDLTPGDLFTEDGRLDTDRLTAAVTELHQTRPDLCGVPKLVVPALGKVPDRLSTRPDFEAAFAPPQT